jgi:hypothetical protein
MRDARVRFDGTYYIDLSEYSTTAIHHLMVNELIFSKSIVLENISFYTIQWL